VGTPNLGHDRDLDAADERTAKEAAAFIARWSGREGGRERSNYALFLTELCDVIGVARPDPAEATNTLNDYVFERHVERKQPDGSTGRGWIDLYKRGCFILEAKQSRQKGGRKAVPEGQAELFEPPRAKAKATSGGIDTLMIHARRQAEGYAHALPADHEYPAFILACDVGYAIEVYADFSRHGRHYSQFPDPRRFRIELAQLADADVRERLQRIWAEPGSLDPARQTAKITREIAGKLAEISTALEARGQQPGAVALFLMRCLFTMFVEDVELIRKDSFKDLLAQCVENPRRFVPEMDDLWRRMDRGEYSPAIGDKILKFNGKLFKNATALALDGDEIGLLHKAASADWRDLDPAIFGSLFEQALDPHERRRLGAHYTPRAFVELLVNATIIEPLTADWKASQSAADRALRAGSRSAAISELRDFLKSLSSVRVLDPACGTGNFLYVALRQIKQLEGEVLKQLRDLGGADLLREVSGISVKPEQFFGMEVNSRAVEIAELVLWIGYLQWHLRTRGAPPNEPILGNNDHVQKRDAVLTWDGYPDRRIKRGRMGKPIVKQNAGGQPIEVYDYPKPRLPDWPAVDFIVGNPPFIGGKDIRERQGDGYVEALWVAHGHINPSADYVMYFWDRAASLLTEKGTRLRRFGLVTTNSIRQVFQRRVVDARLQGKQPISVVMAIPDHPWTKASTDAAAVRIAMTVGEKGTLEGALREVIQEDALDTDQPFIRWRETIGRINSNLSIGTDVTAAQALRSNDGMCCPGVKLHGNGFIVTPAEAARLGLGNRAGLQEHIRQYRNGRDLTAHPRGVMAIDLLGLTTQQVRAKYPEVYEHLLQTVKPDRDANPRAAYRDNWWIFGEPRKEFRPAVNGLARYIATVETAKHRVFQFLAGTILPDNMLVAIASDDAFDLAVLSSHIHVAWTLASGGTLEDRPRYSKSLCFDPFPFPEASETQKNRLRALGEELDALRKTVLAEHPELTLTGIYNAVEKLKSGNLLTATEEDVKARGRVAIIKDLHAQIDAECCAAYGWESEIADAEILARLVSLNARRAIEERRGFIRWMRPGFQIDRFGPLSHRADRVQTIAAASPHAKRAFPAQPREQAAQVLQLLQASQKPLTAEEIAAVYKRSDAARPSIEDILGSLQRLGALDSFDDGRSYFVCAA
jgi:Fe2+ or Zn2+ uptake regulation protein